MHQTRLTLLSYIVRFVEQLASIDLKTAIFYKDMCKSLRIPIASSVSQWDKIKRNVTALTLCESEHMMLIGYKMMHKAMMDMVTMVIHQVKVLLEVVVRVVCLEEVEARLCAITVTGHVI